MLKAISFVFLFLTALGVSAQQNSWGLKGGLNIANLKLSAGGVSASTDDLISFHGGFYGTLMTSETFGFQPEFLYSVQGGKSGGSNFSLSYLNIPVIMRYTFSPGVSLQAGPQIGFLLAASVGGVDAKSGMNTVDFGAGFGLGVERPSGVNFTFRYNLGFSNTLSTATTSAISGLGLPGITMTNQVIQFSLGFKLSNDSEK